MSPWSLSKLLLEKTRWGVLVLFCMSLSLHCNTAPRDRELPASELEAAPSGTATARPIDRVEWPDEPLDDTPAVVTFLSLVRSSDESLRAKVRLFNFTEIDLVELEMELACKDEDGRAIPCIKPWKTTRSIPARSHVSHVIGAHLPAEIDDIQITLKNAKFVDGNKWPVKE